MAFTTIPATSDTAIVRWGPNGYLYAVSRSPFPVTVKFRSPHPAELRDLTRGQVLEGQEIDIGLQPHALRSFRSDRPGEGFTISGYRLPTARRDEIMQAATLRGRGATGASIADRLERECQALNFIECKHILEEPETLDLIAGNATAD